MLVATKFTMKGMLLYLHALWALNSLLRVYAAPDAGLDDSHDIEARGTSPWDPTTHTLYPRQRNEVIRCSPTTPCSNGDCCNGESGFVRP